MRGGRIERFATYLTGEMYALLRQHSMIGRPATEPEDPAGFELGLEAAERNGGAAASGSCTCSSARAPRWLPGACPAALGPYMSGLLTGDEINGAFALLGKPREVTVIGGEERVALSRRRSHATA